ncbi:MAG: MCE family protein, partial [Mycobacterium sp.]
LRVFSDTATGLINDSQADLVKNLKNLEPTLRALADVGPDLDTTIAYLPLFPFPQDLVDRGIRGDFINLFEILDFTVPRLKTGLLGGTHWEEIGAPLVPAPGDPYYLQYTYNPLGAGMAPPPPGAPAPPAGVPPAGPQAPPPGPAFGPPPGPAPGPGPAAAPPSPPGQGAPAPMIAPTEAGG